jgi:nitroreductase
VDIDPSSIETVELALKGLSMPLVEAMESQRAIRRLHPDPVPDELILRMIELAEKAPNGGNEQWFAFVVVKDPAVRAGLAKLNRLGYPGLKFYYRKRIRDDAKWARTWAAIEWQKDHFEEIPVLIVVCANRRIPPWPRLMNSGVYASTFPATQNLLLAARAMGLGAAFISLPLWWLGKARRVLGLPGNITPVAVIPIGWPRGRYGPTTRKPVGEVTHLDRWGNQPWQGVSR